MIGNITRDLELKHIPSAKGDFAVLKGAIATSHKSYIESTVAITSG